MPILNKPGMTVNSEAAGTALSPDRLQLIQRIRRQIADGSYESDRKLNAAILKLVEDLDLQPRRLSRLRTVSGR